MEVPPSVFTGAGEEPFHAAIGFPDPVPGAYGRHARRRHALQSFDPLVAIAFDNFGASPQTHNRSMRQKSLQTGKRAEAALNPLHPTGLREPSALHGSPSAPKSPQLITDHFIAILNQLLFSRPFSFIENDLHAAHASPSHLECILLRIPTNEAYYLPYHRAAAGAACLLHRPHRASPCRCDLLEQR